MQTENVNFKALLRSLQKIITSGAGSYNPIAKDGFMLSSSTPLILLASDDQYFSKMKPLAAQVLLTVRFSTPSLSHHKGCSSY